MPKTTEWCSHCEYEVEIPVGEVSKCPQCGESIRPCGDCPTYDEGDERECDWREDGYCIIFPDFRY
jgi:ribosomal protein L32